MPSKKVTDLSDIGTPASGDKILIVDVSDTTDSAAGTSKYALFSEFGGGGGGGSSDFFVAVSGERDLLTAGTARYTFPWPYSGAEISEVFAIVNEAPTGSAINIDVNDDGASIFTGTLDISTGATSGTKSSLSVTPVQKSIMTVDLDAVGSTSAGRGLKLLFIFA